MPRRPAIAAALHYAQRHSAHNAWTACRMRLHMASAGYGNLRPFGHSGHTPAPCAYRGLPALAFALHGRQRMYVRVYTRRLCVLTKRLRAA